MRDELEMIIRNTRKEGLERRGVTGDEWLEMFITGKRIKKR